MDAPRASPKVVHLGTLPSMGLLMLLVFAIGLLDAVTSNDLAFGAYYLVPVGWGAWLSGRRWGLGLAALALATLFITDIYSGRVFANAFYHTWELFNHGVVLVVVVESMTRLKETLDREHGINSDLSSALAEVKDLKGLLPICAWCKKVRDDEGYWEGLEAYVTSRTHATFSHGICPECRTKHFRCESEAVTGDLRGDDSPEGEGGSS